MQDKQQENKKNREKLKSKRKIMILVLKKLPSYFVPQMTSLVTFKLSDAWQRKICAGLVKSLKLCTHHRMALKECGLKKGRHCSAGDGIISVFRLYAPETTSSKSTLSQPLTTVHVMY